MVEPVSHSTGKARIQRSSADATVSSGNGAPVSSSRSGVQSTGGAAESISISAAAKALPNELKVGPPVDIETVNRIREAIAENRYPIDLKAITDSLFQSFLEVSR